MNFKSNNLASFRIWYLKPLFAFFLLGIASSDAANLTVNMTGFQFSPKDLTVNVGDTVTWVNQDPAFHDTTSGVNRVPSGVWKSPLFGNGGSFSFTFNVAPGTYPYYCTPHVFTFNMVGSITVLAPNAPPSVNIINPSSGASFTAGANVLIEAIATDNNGVARVEFFANGNSIGTDFAAPFSATLTSVAIGNYSLTARAFDAQGLSAASVAVNISVNEATTGPVIISQPQNQSVLPGSTVMFSVMASGTPPLSYQWQFNGTNISGATSDSVTLSSVQEKDSGTYAVLVSNEINSILSATAILTVTPLPNIFPSVTLTSPTNGARFRFGSIIPIHADASDSNGFVAQVEFFLNTNSVAVLTNAPYEIAFSDLVIGNYILTARATDDQAGATISDAVSFSVLDLPTVVLVEPIENARFPLGTNILIAAEATAPGLAVTSVQFFEGVGNNLQPISLDLTNAPYIFLWNPTVVGTHTLLAVLTDELGGTNFSVPVNIEVFEPGTQNPTITITNSPRNFSRLTNTPVFISGIAGDDIRLERVEFQINQGPFLSAMGTTDWFAQIDLAAGTNEINFRSVDFAGNFSTNATRSFTYVVNSPLTVEVVGLGTLSPNLGGRELEIGKIHQMIARPRRGQIFGGWTGGVVSNKAVLNFTMRSNLNLTANFIANPFPNVKGIYTGLIFETNNVRPESSGTFKLKVTGVGKFSGRLTMQNKSYRLHGRLDHLGHAEMPVLRRPIRPVVMTLELDLTGAGGINGHVTDGAWISQLLGNRAVSPAKSISDSRGEKYFFDLVSGDRKWASAVAQADRTLKIRGQFLNGEKLVQTLYLSESGNFPFYFSTRNGGAVLLGWLDLQNAPSEMFGGELIWTTTNHFLEMVEVVPSK